MNATRTRFAALLLVLALPVWAQAPVRIAWLWPGSASGEAVRRSAFKEGMRENGMVEGQHCVLDERDADGKYDRFPALAEELAGKPAILMVNTISSVRAAQQATKTVPMSDAMLFSERARITAFALRNRIPASGTSRDINLKTANALGITIPQSLLLRADEVIQ